MTMLQKITELPNGLEILGVITVLTALTLANEFAKVQAASAAPATSAEESDKSKAPFVEEMNSLITQYRNMGGDLENFIVDARKNTRLKKAFLTLGMVRRVHTGKLTLLVVEPQEYKDVSVLSKDSYMFDEDDMHDGSGLFYGKGNSNTDIATSGGGQNEWLLANNTLAGWLRKTIASGSRHPRRSLSGRHRASTSTGRQHRFAAAGQEQNEMQNEML
ncbi:MAG: hypothetical protein GY883_18345 [Shimia sp.]|nr:hypothetical protein [Shimia sp.]